MTRPILILILLTLGLLSSCRRCDIDTSSWKTDAQKSLAEFKELTEDIKTHPGTFDILKYSGGNLFIRGYDYTDEVKKKYNLNAPKLRQWFQKNKGWLSIEGDTITVCFREIICYSEDYTGYIYHSKTGIRPSFTRNWKIGVQLKDSLDLGDDWYYLLMYCDGCRD